MIAKYVEAQAEVHVILVSAYLTVDGHIVTQKVELMYNHDAQELLQTYVLVLPI